MPVSLTQEKHYDAHAAQKRETGSTAGEDAMYN